MTIHRSEPDPEGGMFRWYRLAATGIASLCVLASFAALYFAYSGAIAPDFLSYWAAARMTVLGHPALVYDLALHHAAEKLAVPTVGYLPFGYPPPFLLIVLPFGMAPFPLAFAGWIAITSALYIVAARRLIDVRFSLAQAAAAANFIIGQNGFLTAAIFIRGAALLATRPFLAGTILGLLSFKPQLAVLLPVALLAGREWRAIGGGILTALVLAVLGLLLFGMASYHGFFALLPQFSQWLSAGRWRWDELASVYALLRFFGVFPPVALAVHVAVALGAAAITAYAWATKSERRVAILAAATLLVSPYLFTYDGLLLTIPMARLFRQGSRREFLVVWALSLLPIVGYFGPFPNTIPIASLVSLWVLRRAPRRSAASIGDERANAFYQV